MEKRSLCVFTFAILVFCASQAVAEQQEVLQEVLLGVSTDFEKGEITLAVASSGCTKEKDFLFEYKENVLTIIRKERDACKAMPQKIQLTFKLKDIGIDPNTRFKIANPFIVNENLTR
jgi:hypothetical protein